MILLRQATTEDELQKKRQEFRDTEIQNKIANLSSAEEYRQQTLKANYTLRRVQGDFGKFGWSIIIGRSNFPCLFSLRFLL